MAGPRKYQQDELINMIYALQEDIGDDVITCKMLINRGMYSTMQRYWGTIINMKKALHLPMSKSNKSYKYTKEEIIDAYKSFYNTHGFFPTSKYITKNALKLNLPSMYYINLMFKSFLDFQNECGHLPPYYVMDANGEFVLEYDDPVFLKELIIKYVKENNRIPQVKEIDEYYGTSLRRVFRKYFGSFNNCIKELNLTRKVREYTDDELRDAFMNFVNKYHRTPSCNDFMNSEYPSYSTYQYRFGSWINACIYYGCKPNCRKPEYYLDDGERCDSRYEVDVSNWLRDNQYEYIRNVPYTSIDNRYTGGMNCDYKITSNNKIWYVEIVGFIRSLHEKHYSDEELKYREKLLYKIKLLERSHVNYKIFYRNELDENSVETLFSFLN